MKLLISNDNLSSLKFFANLGKLIEYSLMFVKKMYICLHKPLINLIDYRRTKAQTESHEGENNTGEQDSSSGESAPEELMRKPNTVLVSQYEELKRKHLDALLLFRCGDFYECYDEDAKLQKRKFRFEKSFEFDNFSICIPQERFSEVISYLALNGFRIAVKTRVPD